MNRMSRVLKLMFIFFAVSSLSIAAFAQSPENGDGMLMEDSQARDGMAMGRVGSGQEPASEIVSSGEEWVETFDAPAGELVIPADAEGTAEHALMLTNPEDGEVIKGIKKKRI